MELAQATAMAANLQIQVFFDKTLKMVAVVFDDTISYMPKDKFESYSNDEFMAELAKKFMVYATSESKIRFH